MECRDGCLCVGDTYIEQKFYEKCQQSSLGNNLWSDWLYNKYQYEERTKTTVYEFMNYSKHDTSHSINILKAIERILGKDRVKLLGLGDMWLILNASYAHDVGMTTEYSELQELWKSKDFLDYISKKRDTNSDDDSTKAANHYSFLDAFIRKQKGKEVFLSNDCPDFKWDDFDSWPLEFRKEITTLMAEYLRPRHGERSEKYFKCRGKNGNILLSNRLNNLLGRIVALHTENQEKIKLLKPKCDGLSDDYVHAQFIAVLIRVGDLLDLDDNRYDIFTLKHYGKLSHISALHYKKHQSVEHLLIQPDKIEVTVKSDDFEVCQITLSWFDTLKSEIINMITRWNEIAPSCLTGCTMGLPELIILHNDQQFSSEFIRNFEFDKEKILDLFMGNNLYDSKLAFIREYVQNSFDALRIKLWNDLDQDNNRRKYLRNSKIKKENIKPIDLTKEAYDNYPVNIYIREFRDLKGNIDEDRFILEFEDFGIGIDENGIKSIAHIGSGWRERTNYTNVIRQMKQWFRPTGGFGIGMQAAFLVTEKVEIFTKAINSPAYQITLSRKNKSNNIMVECGQQQVIQGTKVRFVIDFAELVEEDKNILKPYGGDWEEEDLFDYYTRLEIIYSITKNYVKKMFPNSLFPINVRLEGRKTLFCCIQSKKFFANFRNFHKTLQVPLYMEYAEIITKSNGVLEKDESKVCELLQIFLKSLQKERIACNRLFLNFDMEEGNLRIWDDNTETFYYLEMANEPMVELSFSYKNVYIIKDSVKTTKRDEWNKIQYFTNIFMDVMGSKVEDCLLVSRNQFLEGILNKRFFFDKYTKAYLELMLYRMQHHEKIINCKLWFDMTLICNYIFPQQEYEKYKDILESEGIYIWELDNLKEPLGWKYSYYFYYQLFFGLINHDMIIAIPDAECHINYSMSEESEAFKFFKEKLIIVDDAKTIETLLAYLDKENEIVLKRPEIKDSADSQNALDITAIKIVNPNIIDQQILSPIRREKKTDVNRKSSKIVEREYRLIMDEAPIGQEALVVKRIPFIPADTNKKYIISPYNREIFAKIHQWTHCVPKGAQEDIRFTSQTLIDIVTSDSNFERLCKWVYEHQIRTDKYDMAQICEAYRELLIADYNTGLFNDISSATESLVEN